ncbi:MAG: MarR family transcriptional regulator [Lachnospiraceae bacterium]|nr:MarR family transcriptional regulator [Lachnospiraceae bacterium]
MSNKVSNKNVDEASVEAGLTETQVRILAEIRNDPNITRARLMEKIKVGKTTVYTAISTLKKLGYIERAGSKKSGYWKALK